MNDVPQEVRMEAGRKLDKPADATFLILTYQQERYVAESLESALGQDHRNLRIVVSDDASTDRTPDIVADTLKRYDGPHEVLFIRQPRNLRIHHINALMPEFTKTPFVVIGGGDDTFHPDRVSVSVKTMVTEKTYSATCNAIVIDENGKGDQPFLDLARADDIGLEGLCRNATNMACFGAGLSWRRAVFTQLGRLQPGPRQIDQLIVFRSLLLGSRVSIIREPLMRYRVHDSNTYIGQIARLAKSEVEKLQIEERRRNNVVATLVAMRQLLRMARKRKIGDWDYDALDEVLMESLYDKAWRWSLHRAAMVEAGIGIY